MNDLYNKWLLVSDIDGTLNSKSMKLPENNKIAINNFVNKGGNFTLCSGRNLQSLSIHYKKLGINTPAIFLNGAGIYDFKDNEMIYQNFITSKGEEIILDVLSKHKLAQLTVFTANKIYLTTWKCIYGRVISVMDKLDYELCRKVSDLPRGVWGKVSFFGTKGLVNKLEAFFTNNESSEHFECFKTSPFTLEVVNKGVNKGNAVIKLADGLGMKSLTEGVETKEQADFLKAHGCVRLQGYLFGKPIPREQLYSDIKEKKYIVSKKIL
jgi:Cof subfamily protein (haloacid dehalogenase superfamily)